jgi:predicted thioesterase
MKEITAGVKGQEEVKVTADNTAIAMGSGTLEVFATPAMIALMEKAAAAAAAPYMENDETTVGTQMSVSHVSATPVGMTVTAFAEVTEVNGREITFSVKAQDQSGLIGEGTHKRFVVYGEKFMSKTNSKLN